MMRRLVLAVALICLFSSAAVAQEPLPDALELYRQGNYSRAVEVTLQEIEAQPRRVDSYVVLGWSLLALFRNEEALNYAEDGLLVSRTDQRLLNIAAEAAHALDRTDVALGHLETYVALWPEGAYIADTFALIGSILAEYGEYRNAETAYMAALHHREEGEWWRELGAVREELEELPRAVNAYEAAIAINPGDEGAQESLARIEANVP